MSCLDVAITSKDVRDIDDPANYERFKNQEYATLFPGVQHLSERENEWTVPLKCLCGIENF
jgi:hypothetical protein